MTTESVHTIADIARLAGVSKATVSRALNDSPLISVETKDRIREIAREHRFQMNAPARRLSRKESHAIGLVTYDLKTDAVSDGFMLEVLGGVSSALQEQEYDLLVIHGGGRSDWAREYLDSGRADGFVLFAATCTRDQLRALLDHGAPFVVWGGAPASRAYSSVCGDNVTGGRLATAHLLDSGRRRIAFLGGPECEPEVEDRFRGYTAALADAGRDLDERLVEHVDWHPATAASAARAATQRLLERVPELDGVFANSDVMAIAAIEALRGHGRRVPDDVGVVGYDDIVLARYTSPALTTIRQNGPLAGRLLAETLIQRLRTGAVTNVSIPAELVVRESA